MTVLVAIAAASMAYKGIVEQISSSQTDVTRQIAANQDSVTQQIAAENRRREHEVRVPLIDEVNDLAYDVRTASSSLADRGELGTRVMKLEVKLRLYELRDQSAALLKLWSVVKANAPDTEVEAAYRDLLFTIKTAIPGLEGTNPDQL
ncbi:hypothetical protein [Tsukamurella soli]|uniref:hypothetical protein n=1 Tax=Tsukamurella soli TaxID=644556 RepID=UPI0031EA13E4